MRPKAGTSSCSPICLCQWAVPLILSMTIVAADIGNKLPGSLINDNQPTFGGTGVAGDVVYLYDGNNLLVTFTVQPDGNWSYTPPEALGEGDHTFRVAFGNETQPQTARVPEAGWDIEIDTIPPEPPTRPDPTPDAMALPFSASELLNNALPKLFAEDEPEAGIALPQSIVELADIDLPASEQQGEVGQAVSVVAEDQARLLSLISPDDQPIY